MNSFIEMLEADQDNLPAILGMATAHMVDKSQVRVLHGVVVWIHQIDLQHKARNLLKRVAKMEMSTRDGEDFTKANLLLAKFYVDKVPFVLFVPNLLLSWRLFCLQSKFDMAQELCKKCLAHDRSCSQAWEILGLAMEKETNYENAAECYEKVRAKFDSIRWNVRFWVRLGMEVRIRSKCDRGFQVSLYLPQDQEVRECHWCVWDGFGHVPGLPAHQGWDSQEGAVEYSRSQQCS